MKKVINDAMSGITLLSHLDGVNPKRIGTLGHSYGGNTVLFLSALDQRIAYSCASGSACTFENRIKNNVGIEMASVIPNSMENMIFMIWSPVLLQDGCFLFPVKRINIPEMHLILWKRPVQSMGN